MLALLHDFDMNLGGNLGTQSIIPFADKNYYLVSSIMEEAIASNPFADGNGRTASSLFYWYMIKKGYWLTEYLSISRIIYTNKKSYEKAFLYTENDGNDLSYFIQYHLDVMKKAFGELKKYLQRKIDEQQNILRFAGAANINERQRYVIRTISESKRILFTPKELATQFDISTRTARTDLQELVEMGYLNTTNLNKRAIGYIKSERFESLLNNLIKKDKGN